MLQTGNHESITVNLNDLTSPERARSIRVLHVDDDPAILEVSKQILNDMGSFEISHAFCVDEAFKKLETQAFDVIISDYDMPRKDGLQFLKEIREQKNDTPFIVFTGKGREEVVKKALNLGANGYVSKQGDPETVYSELTHNIITAVEKSRAEDALRDSEAKYSAVVRQAIDGVFIIRDGFVDFANESLAKTLCYSVSEMENKPYINFLAPESRDFVAQRVNGRLAGQAPSLSEAKLLCKDGTIKDAELSGGVIQYGGKPAIVGIVRDITERKRVEEKIRISEENYRNIFEKAGDAIYVHDLKGKICSINKVVEEYGFTKDQIIGKNMFKFIPKKYWPKLMAQLSQLARGIRVEGEVEVNTPVGRRSAEYRSTPIMQGNKIVCVQSVLRDTTHRKKTEKTLRDSEEKFRSLAEELPNIIFINQGGKVVYANKKCEEIMGYSKEEFYSPNFNFLSLVDSQSVGILKSSFTKHLIGEEVAPYEYNLITRNGKKIPAIIASKLTQYEGAPAILGIVTDITERKKAEDEIRQSEQRLKLHFENTPLAVIEWDMDFKVTKWNSAASRIFGFSSEEAISQHANFILPESVKKHVNEVWNSLLAQNGGGRSTNENVTKTGKKIVCEWFNTPLIDSEGKTIGVASLVEDITERTKMSDDLERDRGTLESITQSINAGFVTISKDYHITWANKFIRLYKGDVEGKLCYAVLNTLDKPCSDCGLTKIYAGTTTQDSHEYCSTTIDGKPYWVDIIATPIRDKDGVIVGGSELVVDITERKKAAEALLESQQKFSALFAANPEASVFLDLDFRVIEANAQFSNLFGYSFEEIKGKVITDLIVPEEAKEESRTIRQKILSGQVEVVAARKRKDGTLVPLLMTGGRVLSSDKVIGSVMVYKDISDIITVQEELSKALAKAERLNEKLNVVGGFTRHDVRNKLSAINGYSYILKKKYADRPDIVDGLGRMEQSVKDSMKIFDFARAYELIGAEELVDVNVEKTVDEAVGMFLGLPFKIVNDCAGLTVRADSLLRQLIYNLIDNTIKYGQKTTTARVYYERTAEGELKLIYEDDGSGISSENKKQLFKQGFSTGGSSGFGLFLSKKMIEVYGWTITEEGAAGKGAKFVMTIPARSNGKKEDYR